MYYILSLLNKVKFKYAIHFLKGNPKEAASRMYEML